jgi:hypothetical protein
MRGQIVIVLVAGILIGFFANYGYLTFVRPDSWHLVTSFILANSNAPDLVIAYSYPNVYNTSTPKFTINADLWRISWVTVNYYQNRTGVSPGYGADLYYTIPAKILVYSDAGIVGRIDLLAPSEYNVGPPSSEGGLYGSFTGRWIAISDDGLTYCYQQTLQRYFDYVIGYPTLMTGKGIYRISAENTTGCFKFTIEEYY